ncbi:expressed protein [Echinococcus multilocularis]|uniref:Expressed protein n=1 Tax=Echinococcus multilocularis TaxID=6211 RepID=A0A068YHZ6_ECHMU|nr:expressed protein [Echinococcus multilocularis]
MRPLKNFLSPPHFFPRIPFSKCLFLNILHTEFVNIYLSHYAMLVADIHMKSVSSLTSKADKSVFLLNRFPRLLLPPA